MEQNIKEIKKREFSKGEEIFNAVTHIVGAVFAVVATVLLIVFASFSGTPLKIISAIIYGFSMIVLFVMSSIYHFLRFNKAKRLFRIFDHCSIFILIAGTYTPYCLVTLHGTAWGIIILSLICVFTILGITFNAINMHDKRIQIFSQICYLLMGWCVIIAIVPLLQLLPFAGFIWLLLGGIMYTGGVVFFAFGRKVKYFHSIWHLFVLLGCFFQFISVFFYVIK